MLCRSTFPLYHPPLESLQFGQSGAAIAEELRAGGLSVPLIQVGKMRDAVDMARTLALPGEHLQAVLGTLSRTTRDPSRQ